MHGVLLVDKARDWTSHDVVAALRRYFRPRRVGHAGTLDPAATGVLPVCVGAATRLIEYLHEQSKEYEAEVSLGASTSTYDAEGEVTGWAPVPELREEAVLRATASFVGQIAQRPPPYSAVKVEGKRAYHLARRGEIGELPERLVTVESIEVLQVGPARLRLRVVCGTGTYIRSLAHDLALALGTRGHLASLRRTRVGPYRVEACLPIDTIRALGDEGLIGTLLKPADEMLLDRPAALLDASATRFQAGARVEAPGRGGVPVLRVYDRRGQFLGVGELQAGLLRPLKVVAESGD